MEEQHSIPNHQQDSFKHSTFHNHHSLQQDKIKQQNFFNAQKLMIQQSISQTKTLYVPLQGTIPMKVRNRRFKKLQELRDNQFFSEQAIKLRHPLLYHLYVGQYQFVQTPSSNPQTKESNQNETNLLSSFLQKHLINIEYKELLAQQLTSDVEAILEIEKIKSQDQIQQIKRIFTTQKHPKTFQDNENYLVQTHQAQTEMQIEKSKIEEIGELSFRMKNYFPSQQQIQATKNNARNTVRKNHMNQQENSLSDPDLVSSIYEKLSNQKRLTEEQKSIQQQNLIQFCQELFLQGKLQHLQEIDYKHIDESNEYDDWKEQSMDLEDKFFNQVQEEMDQNSDNYYTGIQDY